MLETCNRLFNWRSVLAMLAAGLVLLVPRPAAADNPVPFIANFQGDFQILFGAGAGGTVDLRFSGDGVASHLGLCGVNGHSTTRPTGPLCSEIVTDRVILTAANGDKLCLVNAGKECLDVSIPDRIFIRGSGMMKVVGGTGRFAGATGNGTFAVVAEVTELVPGVVATGRFALRFEGRISPPAE